MEYRRKGGGYADGDGGERNMMADVVVKIKEDEEGKNGTRGEDGVQEKRRIYR